MSLRTRTEAAHVAGDQAAIERALANVVDNALRYAPAGSEVAVEGRQRASGYELRVADTGRGIPVEDHERVFTRGYRDVSGDGLGLGLAIARDIAQAYGGSLRVERSDSTGTTMLLTLRCGDETPPPAQTLGEVRRHPRRLPTMKTTGS